MVFAVSVVFFLISTIYIYTVFFLLSFACTGCLFFFCVFVFWCLRCFFVFKCKREMSLSFFGESGAFFFFFGDEWVTV